MGGYFVLVVGEDVGKQLAPYRDFENSGGEVDEYVVSLDILKEAREAFDRSYTEFQMDADGCLYDAWDDRFWYKVTDHDRANDPALQGVRSMLMGCHPGYLQVRIPDSERMSFLHWVKTQYCDAVIHGAQEPDFCGAHKFGWIRVDSNDQVVELVRRTIPDGRWWFWVLGDWLELKLKPGATGWVSKSGENDDLRQSEGFAQMACKGAIDFEYMRDEAGAAAGIEWDQAAQARGNMMWESAEAMASRLNVDLRDICDEYLAQPAIRAMQEVIGGQDFRYDWQFLPREEYVRFARDAALAQNVLVVNGQWMDSGCDYLQGFTDQKAIREKWNRTVNQLLDGLADGTLITVVRCKC